MTQAKSFYRKIAYGAGMAALLFPLSWLASPSTVDDEGGVLARMRDDNGLSQYNLGDVDPASETMKLATVGLRGVAVTLLWNQANHYKKTENWSKLTATLDQLSKLQPNFITFWKYQSWNQSYNLSVEFDDYRDRYYYVRRGIEFLEEGEKYNRDNPQILWELGWFIGQKIGRSDEKEQYRRLFKADDDYHDPRDRPVGRRDNWLVSKEWYAESVTAADDKQRGIGRKSPIVFYSSGAKSQMNYSEAIEEEGQFGKAEAGWATGEREWADFGQRDIQHSTGVLLRLGEEAAVQQRLDAADQRLSDLAPGIVRAMLDEVEAEFSEEERAALKTPIDSRTEVQRRLADEAERKLSVPALAIAARIGEQKPELRREAAAAAAEVMRIEDLLRKTKAYKQTANYDYWLTRCEFEQTADAVAARQLCFRGRKAYTDELDPVRAKELYREAMVKWRAVLDTYPVLLDGEGTTGADLFQFVLQYNVVLEQLDEEMPDDFPLWDIVEFFDDDRLMVEELRIYKEKLRASAGGGEPDAGRGADSEAPSAGRPGNAGSAPERPAGEAAVAEEPSDQVPEDAEPDAEAPAADEPAAESPATSAPAPEASPPESSPATESTSATAAPADAAG